MIEFYSQSRAACLDDALSVMANQFDDPPTISVDETIQVPLEEDIADSIPAHSLLADDEPVDMKPGCKHLLLLVLFAVCNTVILYYQYLTPYPVGRSVSLPLLLFGLAVGRAQDAPAERVTKIPMRDDPKVVPRAQRGPSIRRKRKGLPKRKREEMQITREKGQ